MRAQPAPSAALPSTRLRARRAGGVSATGAVAFDREAPPGGAWRARAGCLSAPRATRGAPACRMAKLEKRSSRIETGRSACATVRRRNTACASKPKEEGAARHGGRRYIRGASLKARNTAYKAVLPRRREFELRNEVQRLGQRNSNRRFK